MRNLTWTSAVDALTKIEALAAAAQFLAANATETELSLELMAVVEDIARKAQEKPND